MSQFKFSCPRCEQHLQCDEQFSGREIQCPSCHHLIRIPPVPGKTNQYNAESGQTWQTFIKPAHKVPKVEGAKPKDPPPAP